MRRTLAGLAVSFVALGATHTAAAQKCGQPFEVPAGTPPAAIAKMVVDQIFNNIVLTDAQQQKAVAIVTQANADASKIDRKAADAQEKFKALNVKRNADLMKLVTKDADKAKLTTCFKDMERPTRGGGGQA